MQNLKIAGCDEIRQNRFDPFAQARSSNELSIYTIYMRTYTYVYIYIHNRIYSYDIPIYFYRRREDEMLKGHLLDIYVYIYISINMANDTREADENREFSKKICFHL